MKPTPKKAIRVSPSDIPKPKPCEHCGACPTCGHAPLVVAPQIIPMPYPVYPRPWGGPYWISTTPSWTITQTQNAAPTTNSYTITNFGTQPAGNGL